MSAVGVSIQVSGGGDASALHDAIWELVESWIDMYTAGTTYRAAANYLRDDAIPSALEDNGWGVQGSTLLWMFDNFGGKRSQMAAIWTHWVDLALASEWDRVLERAQQNSLEITTERPSLAVLLADARGLVAMRDELWTANDQGLASDSVQVPVAALDADERARYDVARTRCMCGPCTMLRPEPSFEKGILGTLDNPEAASSAAWYIERWQRGSPEILLALVRAAGDSTIRDTIEHCAAMVANPASIIVPVLPTLTGTPRARAFYVLASVTLDDSQREQLLHELRVSLDGSDAATEAAAEVAGIIRGGDPELLERVAAILDRDASEELRHQAVLGLANAHFERAPSPPIQARLEREATRETEAGKLAGWFLRSFPVKR